MHPVSVRSSSFMILCVYLLNLGNAHIHIMNEFIRSPGEL